MSYGRIPGASPYCRPNNSSRSYAPYARTPTIRADDVLVWMQAPSIPSCLKEFLDRADCIASNLANPQVSETEVKKIKMAEAFVRHVTFVTGSTDERSDRLGYFNYGGESCCPFLERIFVYVLGVPLLDRSDKSQWFEKNLSNFFKVLLERCAADVTFKERFLPTLLRELNKGLYLKLGKMTFVKIILGNENYFNLLTYDPSLPFSEEIIPYIFGALYEDRALEPKNTYIPNEARHLFQRFLSRCASNSGTHEKFFLPFLTQLEMRALLFGDKKELEHAFRNLFEDGSCFRSFEKNILGKWRSRPLNSSAKKEIFERALRILKRFNVEHLKHCKLLREILERELKSLHTEQSTQGGLEEGVKELSDVGQMHAGNA